MKDSLGNELKVGMKVQLVLPTPHLIGYITKIETGAIVTGLRRGGAEVSPSTLEIQGAFVIPVDPTSPVVSSVTCVLDPQAGASEPVPPRIQLAN